jgi:hypothetical protein
VARSDRADRTVCYVGWRCLGGGVGCAGAVPMTAPKMPPRSAEEIARELESMAQAAGAEADRPQTALEDSMYQSGLQFAYEDSAQRVRAFAAQQHRDLAGRIRALVCEYAGRWADFAEVAEGFDDHSVVDACVTATTFLVRAHKQAKRSGAVASELLDEMRRLPGGVGYRTGVCCAADDLERIVRECSEPEPR